MNKTKICLNCKNKFNKSSHMGISVWRKRKYCSVFCRAKHLSVVIGNFKKMQKKAWEARRGKPSWNKGKKMPPETVEKNRIAHLGQKAWNSKGGTMTEEHKQRLLFFRTIRRDVLKRDKYSCTRCGDNKGGNLQVDHIESWKDYVNQRFNINNCRTLCKICHFEITYGKKMTKKSINWGTKGLEKELERMIN